MCKAEDRRTCWLLNREGERGMSGGLKLIAFPQSVGGSLTKVRSARVVLKLVSFASDMGSHPSEEHVRQDVVHQSSEIHPGVIGAGRGARSGIYGWA
ncbi:hypothetical protein DACRYDRAFT_21220 [Dacryopinax primogenitus]|uniref:Uncharacterized protein n=1 Tax=Dacryopinax primogenitus (strain DJM 731) TaxID=1858805 RepID=M5G0I8_DACPD|nr:uncharacterized protein DACRYDRAFT_21220 [Dacryopinax primogenitus]EJU03761.1 hypothetical protein DACRYDRAFT_21220 [Dacryopinax primogenitus]